MEKIYVHQLLVLSNITHGEFLNNNEEIFNKYFKASKK
jgi:hypothetical protein